MTDLDLPAIAPGDAGHYQWWYFDALSDDGQYGLVAIFFVGGVFSALYADRLAAGEQASPWDHPMVNLALYRRGRRIAWVFSEYPREELRIGREGLDLAIAGSRVVRTRDGYDLEVHDDDLPRGRPMDLRARFTPTSAAVHLPTPSLDARGRHFWGSPAPACRVDVACDALGLRWSGHGYHDVNRGTEPLHEGFRRWSWGRAMVNGHLGLYYDAIDRDGRRLHHAHGRDGWMDGATTVVDTSLTPWLVRTPQRYRAATQSDALLVERTGTWESSPFYLRHPARFGTPAGTGIGICEHVDLERFASPFVRQMLRYRIYRRPARGAPPLARHVTWPEVVAHARSVSSPRAA